MPRLRPPPLPATEWASEVISRARGERARDPLELGHGGSLVRARNKGRELGGAFTCGMQSTQVERLLVAASRAPAEGPYTGVLGSSRSKEGSARWVGADFMHTRVATPNASVLLTNHRSRYVDAAELERSSSCRERDLGAEISPRLSRAPKHPIDYSLALTPREPPVRRHDVSRGERLMEESEIAAARSLISTSLRMHRKYTALP
jgi:hypothetical protein